MSINARCIGAVVRKELREYRRNRFIISTMAILPVLFLILPIVYVFRLAPSARASAVRPLVGATLLMLLLTPVIVPATIAAYSVIGERDQGTLEPLLTTPIRREEFLLGKALAAIIPSAGIAYTIFAIFVVSVRIGAIPAVVAAVWQAPQFLAQGLFAPLLATWSIWVGMAVSTRSTDVRVAQQLGTLGTLPALGLTSLMSFAIIEPSVGLAIGLAFALTLVDVVAWLAVSALFDRERLVTGGGYGRRRG